jgi:hypothetical protein
MANCPSSEESFAMLQAAGWSIGDLLLLTDDGPAWLVTGTNGENSIEARAPGQAEAWHKAVEQARSLGMLGAMGSISKYGPRQGYEE